MLLIPSPESTRYGLQIRTLLQCLLHERTLTLPLTASAGVGKATNLLSNDCDRIFEATCFMHYTWLAPLFIFVMLVLMYQQIGVAALVGFTLLALALPLNVVMGKRRHARAPAVHAHACLAPTPLRVGHDLRA